MNGGSVNPDKQGFLRNLRKSFIENDDPDGIVDASGIISEYAPKYFALQAELHFPAKMTNDGLPKYFHEYDTKDADKRYSALNR